MNENEVKVYVDKNPENKLPMKWFTFYKVLLVIWIVGYAVYGVLSAVLGFINSDGSSGYTAVMLILAVISLALCVFCIYLFRNLRKFSLKAYKANMWFIMIIGIFGAAGAGMGVLTMLLSGFGKGAAIVSGIISGAMGLIYPACSIVYFEKRKHLFTDGEEVNGPEITAEISETEEICGEQPATKGKSLFAKYLIAHIVVAVVSLALAAVLTPSGINGDFDDYYDDLGILAPGEGSYTEEASDPEDVKVGFDNAAVYLGYADADELMSEIEVIEAEEYDNVIDLRAMPQEEAYQFIFVDYFGCATYEEALFAVNPYTEEVITSFTDYQDYVMADLEAYFEYFE